MPPFKAKLYDPRRDTSPTSEDNLKAYLVWGCLLACLLAGDRVSLYSFAWPGAHYVNQANLVLTDFSHLCL